MRKTIVINTLLSWGYYLVLQLVIWVAMIIAIVRPRGLLIPLSPSSRSGLRSPGPLEGLFMSPVLDLPGIAAQQNIRYRDPAPLRRPRIHGRSSRLSERNRITPRSRRSAPPAITGRRHPPTPAAASLAATPVHNPRSKFPSSHTFRGPAGRCLCNVRKISKRLPFSDSPLAMR